MACNTTCYKRDTCNTKWHRGAILGVPAKAMTNIRTMFKVADMFTTHQRLYSESQSCIHLFVNTRPTAPKVATRPLHLWLQLYAVRRCDSLGHEEAKSVALSTCEAEIMTGSLAACEAVYVRDLLTELGFPPPGPTELSMDNSGAMSLAHDPVSHASSKHIHRRELKIRKLITDGAGKPKYVKS
eukprot:6211863-Pleurochrysis_carterae.AAC.1